MKFKMVWRRWLVVCLFVDEYIFKVVGCYERETEKNNKEKREGRENIVYISPSG